jgi:hypothetical protein
VRVRVTTAEHEARAQRTLGHKLVHLQVVFVVGDQEPELLLRPRGARFVGANEKLDRCDAEGI